MLSRLGSRAIRVFYPHGAVRRVRRGYLKGARFVVAPGMATSYAFGYAFPEAEILASAIAPGSVIYDIGANRGQLTLFFDRLTGESGRVFAFEPISDHIETLRRNIELNSLANVTVVTAAVASRTGTVSLNYSPEQSTMARLSSCRDLAHDLNAESRSVACVTLDDFVRTNPSPDILKIDVEGGAAEVLRGAQHVLDTVRPAIYVEIHGAEERLAVRNEICGRGYSLSSVSGRNVTLREMDRYGRLWCVYKT